MKYDIMHFEALGKEAEYLKDETLKLISEKVLPEDFNYLITPLTLQEYISENKVELPDIITTKTHSVLPEYYVEQGNKKSVITRSAGYDHFETLSNKLNIASLREYCVDAVAQTAVKFVYCTCGYLNEYVNNTKVFERNNTTSFMELGKNRVATVYGVGKIGKKAYDMLQANGLEVLAVDIREDYLKMLPEYSNVKFVSKEDGIKNADIIVNVMNLTKIENSKFYNANYFNEEYLTQSEKKIFFINVTRGEIAPEKALLKLYRDGKILGLGLDVFGNESILTNCLRSGDFSKVEDENILAAKEIICSAVERKDNFYVQSHQGFNSDLAALSKAKEAINHVRYWLENEGKGFKEQLPYYSC